MIGIDQANVEKFDALAETWWNTQGSLRTLHAINPIRLRFILEQQPCLAGKKILDIGCGGGILSESLAGQQAYVTGIDASEACIDAAKQHAALTHGLGSHLHYAWITDTPAWALDHAGQFDTVVCMELLEHLENPSTMLSNIATVLKPGGSCFFSTIHRSVFAYLTVILGAEYLLGLLPKGTHDYAHFIKPSELADLARSVEIDLLRYQGMSYQPLTQQAYYISSLSANYLAYGIKPCQT